MLGVVISQHPNTEVAVRWMAPHPSSSHQVGNTEGSRIPIFHGKTVKPSNFDGRIRGKTSILNDQTDQTDETSVLDVLSRDFPLKLGSAKTEVTTKSWGKKF